MPLLYPVALPFLSHARLLLALTIRTPRTCTGELENDVQQGLGVYVVAVAAAAAAVVVVVVVVGGGGVGVGVVGIASTASVVEHFQLPPSLRLSSIVLQEL